MKLGKIAKLSAIGFGAVISTTFSINRLTELNKIRNQLDNIQTAYSTLYKLPRILETANNKFTIYKLPQMKFCQDPIEMTNCFTVPQQLFKVIGSNEAKKALEYANEKVVESSTKTSQKSDNIENVTFEIQQLLNDIPPEHYFEKGDNNWLGLIPLQKRKLSQLTDQIAKLPGELQEIELVLEKQDRQAENQLELAIAATALLALSGIALAKK